MGQTEHVLYCWHRHRHTFLPQSVYSASMGQCLLSRCLVHCLAHDLQCRLGLRASVSHGSRELSNLRLGQTRRNDQFTQWLHVRSEHRDAFFLASALHFRGTFTDAI